MDSMHLCLTSTYFEFSTTANTTSSYKEQLRAPLFPVLWLKYIVMQNIEEQALGTYNETFPLWLRYVDDVRSLLCTKTKSMNSMNTWTDRILAPTLLRRLKRTFLDFLVTHENNTLRNTQNTNTRWQTTWPNVLQSYFIQSDYGTVRYGMIIANSALRVSLAIYHLISNCFMAVGHVSEYHLLTIWFELQPLSLYTPL
mgnify:CR=1 FL=1